jgi:hypothetical protein
MVGCPLKLNLRLVVFSFYFAGAVVEAFVRLHEKGLIYQGIIMKHGYMLLQKGTECALSCVMYLS